MRSQIFKVLFSSFLFVLLVPAFAIAKDESPMPTVCKEDTERLCKKVKPGEGRVMKCLKDNELKITVACKEKVDEFMEVTELHSKIKNFRTACKTDLETLCEGVQKGKGRQVKCLKSHSDKLTQVCRSAMENEGITLDAAKAEIPTIPGGTAPGTATGTTGTSTTTAPAAPAAPAVPPVETGTKK